MRIHDLEYLPIERIALDVGRNLDRVEAVSLYGYWCHLRYHGGRIVSVPVHRVLRIDWSAPTEPRF